MNQFGRPSLPSAPSLPASSLPASPSPSTSAVVFFAQPVVKPQTGRRILLNTGALTLSNLWRILVSFVLQLLIARTFGVDGLGQYTIALAYLNVCQVISELGLPALLVRDLAQKPQQRRAYFQIALSIECVATLLVWGGLIVVTTLLPLSPISRMMLWVVGGSLPFYALTSVTQMLFQSGERMELVMGIEVLINSLILGLSIAVIWLQGAIIHLVSVLVLTQALSAGLGLWWLRRSQLLSGPQENVPWRLAMMRQRAMPFWGLALADVLLQRADILLLSIFGGETVTGTYSAAYNLVRVAVKVVQSFWMALYPTLSRLRHQSAEQYARLRQFSLRYCFLLVLLAAGLGTGLASELLALIYGPGYADATPVLQLLIWMALLYVLESYAVTLLMVEHRPYQSLLISGAHLVALLLFCPLLAVKLAATGAALAALLAGGVGVVVGLGLLQRVQAPLLLTSGWRMIGVTFALLVVVVYLPAVWPVRLAFGLLVYWGLAWQTGLIAGADYQMLRRAILRN